MNAIQKERATKLAKFLRQLPEYKFNFTSLTSPGVFTLDDLVHGCGTSACAVGWMPYVFPEDWSLDSRGWPVRNTDDNRSENEARRKVAEDVEEFLGVHSKFFFAMRGYPGLLMRDITPVMMADLIEREIHNNEQETS